MSYPDSLLYTDSHEYVRQDGDVVTVGITLFAVEQLGDIVFVSLPEVGESVAKGDPFSTVESVKAVAEIYAPVDGTVIEVNSAVDDAPELISEDSYGEGWLIKVRLNDGGADLSGLMTASQYQDLICS
ncbi:MAG: glycine cleavage system protein GcvH [Pseudanabaena sp. ELA607]